MKNYKSYRKNKSNKKNNNKNKKLYSKEKRTRKQKGGEGGQGQGQEESGKLDFQELHMVGDTVKLSNEAINGKIEESLNFFIPKEQQGIITDNLRDALNYNKFVKPKSEEYTISPNGKPPLEVKELNESSGYIFKNRVLYNTSIYTLSLHGVTIPDHNFIIPENTIICYVSPIGNISYNFKDNQKNKNSTEIKYDSDLIEQLANLNFNQFKEIVRNRSLLRDLPFFMRDARKNCFTHSVWYYPGQVCPKIYLTLKKHEYESFRQSFLQIHFKNNKARVVRDIYHDLGLPDKESQEFIDGFFRTDSEKLLDRIPIVQNEFNIIFSIACRAYTDESYIKNFIKSREINHNLEMLYLHHNLLYDWKSIKEEKHKFTPELYKNWNACNSVNMFTYHTLSKVDISKMTIFNEQEYTNFDIDTLHLQKLADNLLSHSTKHDDLLYLASLTPVKILNFFTATPFAIPEDRSRCIKKFFTSVDTSIKYIKVCSALNYFQNNFIKISAVNEKVFTNYFSVIESFLILMYKYIDTPFSHKVYFMLFENYSYFYDKYSKLYDHKSHGIEMPVRFKTMEDYLKDDTKNSYVNYKHLFFDFDFVHEYKAAEKLQIGARPLPQPPAVVRVDTFSYFYNLKSLIVRNIISNEHERIENLNIKTLSLHSEKEDSPLYKHIVCPNLKNLSLNNVNINHFLFGNLTRVSLYNNKIYVGFIMNLLRKNNIKILHLEKITLNPISLMLEYLNQKQLEEITFIELKTEGSGGEDGGEVEVEGEMKGNIFFQEFGENLHKIKIINTTCLTLDIGAFINNIKPDFIDTAKLTLDESQLAEQKQNTLSFSQGRKYQNLYDSLFEI